MNIRNCPFLVISSFTSLNFKSYDSSSDRVSKIGSGDFKSRIDACQKDCAFLRDRFRIQVGLRLDTNIQMKMKGNKVGVQQPGKFLLVC